MVGCANSCTEITLYVELTGNTRAILGKFKIHQLHSLCVSKSIDELCLGIEEFRILMSWEI